VTACRIFAATASISIPAQYLDALTAAVFGSGRRHPLGYLQAP